MNYRLLCITDRSDLPETELFIGLKSAGVDIEVCCNPTGKHYQRLKKSGVSIIDLILNGRFDLSGIRRLSAQLKTKKYDILYCFNNHAASNALIASKGMQCKIITYRGIVGNMSFLSPASWTTHLHPRVIRIACVCNAVRDFIASLRFLWFRVSPERIVTIYKGHDLSWYQNDPVDLTEFNIPADAFVVGFAGRNRPRKGIDVLINSAHWLPINAPIHFLLLGELIDDKKLRRLIEASPLREKIHLPGFRNDAPAIAAACDTFVLPSLEREGLARAVIEAMAYATPPIVTDVGGLPELVVDNESGFVVPPNDPKAIALAILELFNDPAKKKIMGETARQRIQAQFNIGSTIAKTKQMFEELVAG